jgi:hypothetical protein
VIQHDLSEAVNEQEAIEKMPPWILELIQVIIRLSDHQRETSQRLQQLAGLIHQQMSSVNANVKNCNR